MSLIQTVKNAGVIGCGGAGFPTHVKIDTRVDTVLANGAECEPLLNSDQRVMELYADELVEGILLIMEHTGAKQGFIVLKKTYHHAIDILEKRLRDIPTLKLALLDNFYPAGDEQILLTEVTGRIVPEGGIPLMVNAVVSNVLTMVQVARATKGICVTEREISLVGEVNNPQVVTAPIGMPILQLLEMAGPKIPLEDIVVIDGGPMMGKIVDIDGFVSKTTSGLIFLDKTHSLIRWKTMPMDHLIRRSIAACCQCRECTEICSRYMQGHSIQPHAMMRTLAYNLNSPTWPMSAAFLCSQCGLCEFVCPMDLSPKRAFAEILKGLRAAGAKNPHSLAPKAVHEFNRYRKMSKERLINRYVLRDYDSHDLPLTKAGPVEKVSLSLTQAIGAPCLPVVKEGDKVVKGELVARIQDNKLGANLHASISGVIKSVNAKNIVIEAEK